MLPNLWGRSKNNMLGNEDDLLLPDTVQAGQTGGETTGSEAQTSSNTSGKQTGGPRTNEETVRRKHAAYHAERERIEEILCKHTQERSDLRAKHRVEEDARRIDEDGHRVAFDMKHIRARMVPYEEDRRRGVRQADALATAAQLALEHADEDTELDYTIEGERADTKRRHNQRKLKLRLAQSEELAKLYRDLPLRDPDNT